MDSAPSRKRRWLFRLGALGVGLGIVLLLEILLSAVGIGSRHRAPRRDVRVADYYPYRDVSFPPRDVDGRRLCGPHAGNVAPDNMVMRPGLFPCDKPASAYRIFVLGGSSVQGWEIPLHEQVFSEVMAADLAERKRTPIEVINGGVSTWNSFQLLPLVDEALSLGADLIVVYAGHNDYGYFKAFDAYLEAGPTWVWLQSRSRELALYQAGLLLLARLRPGAFPTQVPTDREFDEQGWGRSEDGTLLARDGYREHHLLVQWEAPEVPTGAADQRALYRRLRNEQELVDRRFRENIGQMAAKTHAAGARFAITEVVSNLYIAPRCWAHWDVLSEEELARVEELLPMLWDGSASPEERQKTADEGLRLVPHHALVEYLAGELAYEMEDYARAIELFGGARDDMPVCFSRRAPSRHNRTVKDLAGALGVSFIPLEAAVAAAAETPGLPGSTLFRDNLHLTEAGHKVVGRVLVSALDAEGLLPD